MEVFVAMSRNSVFILKVKENYQSRKQRGIGRIYFGKVFRLLDGGKRNSSIQSRIIQSRSIGNSVKKYCRQEVIGVWSRRATVDIDLGERAI